MFGDYDKNLMMLQGAYKKLKSYYYYDKSLLYLKKKIAKFETSKEVFSSTFSRLAMCLKGNDVEYMDQAIAQIGFVVLPKRMRSVSHGNGVVKSNVDHSKNVSRINYYIDAPIEVFILDTLWMLLIGKIQADNHCKSRNSYANTFKKSVFSREQDLFLGIDFESYRCFEPYYKQYSKWRDNAFSAIEKEQHNSDLIMMSLDLQSFYYSVNFDFHDLPALFKDDPRIQQIALLSGFVEKVYHRYTTVLQRYRKGIPDNGRCVFPIGLLSPMVLRESYLKTLDDTIFLQLQPRYYARYVDDIILVLRASGMEEASRETLISHYLVGHGIVTASDENEYRLVLHPSIKLQEQKINCFFFKKDIPNILSDIYKRQIGLQSSEANFLPDVDVLSSSFNTQAYDLSSDVGSNKIRDLRLLQSNNYNAACFVSKLKCLLKNTSIQFSMVQKYLDQIMQFYHDSQGIEFMNSWKSIFELFILCYDRDRANQFYCNMRNYIKRLNFDLIEDELYLDSSEALLEQMKKNLRNALDISMSLAIALNYDMGKTQMLLADAEMFRDSNMINHALVSIPLLNYVTEYAQKIRSLVDINHTLQEVEEKSWSRQFKLDPEKLNWSPRFIHLEELYFCFFIFDFDSPRKRYLNHHQLMYAKYCEINHLGLWGKPPAVRIKDKPLDPRFPTLLELKINRETESKLRIGVVSTPVLGQNVLSAVQNPYSSMTLEKKERLFRILNTAKREKAKYLSFPEFYMPIAWLPELGRFAKQENMTIVTGLQYVTRGKQAYNFTCVIEPTQCSKKYRNAILSFKEKLYYAPEERKLLARLGYVTKNSEIPFYIVYLEDHFTFSTILCFEFTDIYSRAALKGKIDALFVPQLNRDTNYFSSIVSATSRDLHCFIIQTNTSIFGDSRITGPFKTEMKNILRIKGGTNDVVILGDVDVQQLRTRQENYEKEISASIQMCLNCKNINKNCETCMPHKKSSIKGTPPNFYRE